MNINMMLAATTIAASVYISAFSANAARLYETEFFCGHNECFEQVVAYGDYCETVSGFYEMDWFDRLGSSCSVDFGWGIEFGRVVD